MVTTDGLVNHKQTQSPNVNSSQRVAGHSVKSTPVKMDATLGLEEKVDFKTIKIE